MIKSLTVTNYVGDSWEIELAKPEKYGIAITDITGIDAVTADIYDQEMASSDGSIYTSSRATKRNIVISATLLPVTTVNVSMSLEEVRHLLYKMFPVKHATKLRFETETRVCEINGYVESNAHVIFKKQVTIQVSVICPYPYFHSVEGDGSNVIYFYAIEPMFEFPFSNESLTDNLIEFGEIVNRKENVIVYEGDEDTGIIIHIDAFGSAGSITIYDVLTRESMRLDNDKLQKMTGKGISQGDSIIISTVKNDKYIQLLRDGVYTNILNCLDRDSDWIGLSNGDNVFAYEADSGADNLQFRIEHDILYTGV